ncbi:uncharacterized protein LOC112053335 [Bicyclus anynana]|uniref:Uncharacterized protein LOC112053335 n=1 Tax=Bicyclus anynana TaxID=110368 RepID=A0ABM3LX62_BICAN|nr:uncharacterized protein LOC112053335 [Bicyclus anynana]XP_052743675.1 uncharacterized protein LOC112053335 [Bicyclus anynana]
MALVVILVMAAFASNSKVSGEMALANITRFANGDLFSLVGTDCGLTRCMEVSHGTALAAMGDGCLCQCRKETPAFREDRRICVNNIDECPMASFGRGATKPQIPFVFLPLKGQIIYPSKEIVFTDVEDAICAVTSAQYLSPSGWVTLRDLVDNDVPFGLYRDEGSTYLQWRGSPSLHSRLEGRLVTAHVLCSAHKPAHLAASCAAFRIAGITRQTLLDVRSIPFHAGETVTSEPASQSQGLSVLESLAIGVCVLMIVFVYAAGIIFYIHYKQKQRRKSKDPELNHSQTTSTDNASSIIDSHLGMDSMRMKTNPLMTMESARSDYTNDAGLSDVSEHTEDTFDSSSVNTQKFQDRNSNVISAVVHSRRKKPSRPSIRASSTPERVNERVHRRSASPEIEKAPHSDLSILHCSIENNETEMIPPPPEGEPVIRRKLYFNPVFFEIEHLKSPPPAAIDFLIKLREVMSIAKEKMISKRFIPILSDIPEEESYHTVDLGWDIPCARRGRRFSAISLKRENSRRAILCGGCPGCNSSERAKKNASLIRSNSCKTCVSDDYKQRIVQKWLDEVPTPTNATRPVKSIAKVSGTPRVIEPKDKEEVRINIVEPVVNEESEPIRITDSIMINLKCESIMGNPIIQEHKKNETSFVLSAASNSLERKSPSNHATRIVRKKLPPPPPPPIEFSDTPDTKEAVPVSPEVKRKMQAVIRELNKCRRVEPNDFYDILQSQSVVPKLVIPVVAADTVYYSDDNRLSGDSKNNIEIESNEQFDSLDRKMPKKRRFSLDYAAQSNKKEILSLQNTNITRDRRTRSWRDLKYSQTGNNVVHQTITFNSDNKKKYSSNNDVFVNSVDPIYNNIENPGPLTIEVRGSPVDNNISKISDDFDPDTLDRKPKKSAEDKVPKKRVEKILLKSEGSFKCKLVVPESQPKICPTEDAFTRKIGSLREIYEARNKAHNEARFYERRGSVPYGTQELAAYVKNLEQPKNLGSQFDPKPPMPPKQKRGSEFYSKGQTPRNSPPSDRYRSSEERDRFPPQARNDERRSDLNARRSGRRSARTRPRRVDIRKLCRTEDSGYLSTDSNESKQRARYLLQFKPKLPLPEPILKMPVSKVNSLHIDTDTDDLESLCDGRSESGGESVETDSVFFGNFKDSKDIFDELGYGSRNKLGRNQEQVDSGFVGETNIILSGDSDSEHKSVISIVTGRDGRASAASISNLDDSPYVQSVEC